MKKQDRQGVRTPADLERKYALGGEEYVLSIVNNVKQRMAYLESSIGTELNNMLVRAEEEIEKALSNLEHADVYRAKEFADENGDKEFGAGIGADAEEPNTLRVGWDARFDQSVIRTGNKYAFSSPGTDGVSGYVRMARIKLNQSKTDVPISFVLSQRGAMSPMVVHACFGEVQEGDSSLSSFTYEGTNYAAFLVKSASLVWELYVKKASPNDVITLQDWWTAPTTEKSVAVSFVGDLASAVPNGLVGYHRALPLATRSILDSIMPVGYVLILWSQADPNEMYAGTKWTRVRNTFLWACDEDGEIGLAGGEKTHLLTADELPVHSHGAVYSGNASGTKTHAWLASGGSSMAYGTVDTGGGKAHNNMPPYVQVAIWRRTE